MLRHRYRFEYDFDKSLISTRSRSHINKYNRFDYRKFIMMITGQTSVGSSSTSSSSMAGSSSSSHTHTASGSSSFGLPSHLSFGSSQSQSSSQSSQSRTASGSSSFGSPTPRRLSRRLDNTLNDTTDVLLQSTANNERNNYEIPSTSASSASLTSTALQLSNNNNYYTQRQRYPFRGGGGDNGINYNYNTTTYKPSTTFRQRKRAFNYINEELTDDSDDEYIEEKRNKYTIIEWRQKDNEFAGRLLRKNLIIKKMLSDGACLFRAVALQLLGHQRLHFIIRRDTMNYIVSISRNCRICVCPC